MKHIVYILFLLVQAVVSQQNKVSLVVLGTVQDGGSPHIGCQKDCCAPLWDAPDPTRKVVALGVIDHEHGKTFLFEATPNLPSVHFLLCLSCREHPSQRNRSQNNPYPQKN